MGGRGVLQAFTQAGVGDGPIDEGGRKADRRHLGLVSLKGCDDVRQAVDRVVMVQRHGTVTGAPVGGDATGGVAFSPAWIV